MAIEIAFSTIYRKKGQLRKLEFSVPFEFYFKLCKISSQHFLVELFSLRKVQNIRSLDDWKAPHVYNSTLNQQNTILNEQFKFHSGFGDGNAFICHKTREDL